MDVEVLIMGFLEILTIVFVVLKLCGAIDWSWWLVLLPMFIAVALYILISSVCVVLNLKAYRAIKRNFK